MCADVLQEWNERLEIYRDKAAALQHLQKRSEQLRSRLNEEQNRAVKLEVILEQEQTDVDLLLKLSWSNLFHTMLRSKEEQLDLEKQQALAAALKLQDSRQEITKLGIEIVETGERLAQAFEAEAEYTRLLSLKEQFIRNGQSEQSVKLTQLDEQLRSEQANMKELKEAASACQRLVSSLHSADDKLDSAKNWGTFDMLGGGLISTAIKHSRIDEARDAISGARHMLSQLQAELKDLDQSTEMTIQISSMATFADFFFDGLIVDWVIQGKIKESISQIQSQLSTANTLQSKLNGEIVKSESRQTMIRLERETLISLF